MIPEKFKSEWGPQILTAAELEIVFERLKTDLKKTQRFPKSTALIKAFRNPTGDIDLMGITIGLIDTGIDPREVDMSSYYKNLGRQTFEAGEFPGAVLTIGPEKVKFAEFKEEQSCYTITAMVANSAVCYFHFVPIMEVRGKLQPCGIWRAQTLPEGFATQVHFWDGFLATAEGNPPELEGGCMVEIDLKKPDNGRPPPPATPRRLVCPLCRGPLIDLQKKPAEVLGTQETWDNEKAGDYACDSCPPNFRGNNPRCYFWEKELPPLDPNGV